jgi:hypothetical protein
MRVCADTKAAYAQALRHDAADETREFFALNESNDNCFAAGKELKRGAISACLSACKCHDLR